MYKATSRSEAAAKAAATRKANKQAKQDRHDARIAAYQSLPESVLEKLDEAVTGVVAVGDAAARFPGDEGAAKGLRSGCLYAGLKGRLLKIHWLCGSTIISTR